MLLAFALWQVQPVRAQAPVNDSFLSSIQLTGSTNIVTGSNVGATSETGEPSRAGNAAAASVWWSWVAPDDGPVVVDTFGTAFDTVLGVYTGDAVNALTLVAENDDAPGVPTSLVAFAAIKGTTYRIAVDGYQGASGTVRLAVRLPVAPAAPFITSQPASVTVSDNIGSNVTFSVGVTGSFPLVFQWQKGGVSFPGGNQASYTVTNATVATAGDYRVVITNAFGSLTSSVAVLTVLTTLPQDQFAGRVTFTGQTNTVTGHNLGATTEPGEPVHAGVPNGASIWWSWTAPQNGLVQLDTAGSTNAFGGMLDTVLAVYVGTVLNTLTPVAANQDEVPGFVTTSKVFFRAAAGVTYQFAVAGLRDTNGDVAVGNIALNLAQAPNNDYFTNALVFPPGARRVYDNNVGATEELGEPDHAGNPGGKSVWWTWVAPTNGTYLLDTVGSSMDTLLAIYTGSAINALSLVGEDDNRSDGGASVVKFFGVGGTAYQIAVDGFAGTNGISAGDIVLNLNPTQVLNDDFAERVTLGGQTNRVMGSNLGATKELGEPNHGGNAGGSSLWWTWTAPISGPVAVTTLTSTFDTTLAVYTGSTVSGLTLVAENDDADPVNALAVIAALFPGAVGQTNLESGSLLFFPAVAGQTYQIAVDGYRSDNGTVAAGTVVLGLRQPSLPTPGGNDLFANRYAITGQTNTSFGFNTNATDEVGEPNHDGNDGGRSIWWSWVAPATGPVTINTVGSSFDTLLGVYLGTNVSALTLVAADTRSADNGKSVVTFTAIQGVEYQIAVDGFNDGTGAATGRVVLNLRQHPPGVLQANDDFANATPIVEPFLTVNGNNIGATRQPGEPAHVGAQQGHSVWWTWTAPVDGPVTIATTNSQFDTLLGVYTGTSVEALTLVAENDDIDGGNEQSGVTFQAIAGTVYRIAVDGYGNEVGFIVLTVSPGLNGPAAPQIQQAPIDQTRFTGGAGGGTNVLFRVVATGTLPLTYQWLHAGTNLPGATNNVLTVTNAAGPNAGTYQVAISNAYGVTTSDPAQLTVQGVPFNDDFASRVLVTGASNVVRGSISGAGKELNEPHHGGDVGGRSVWWKWTAPANGLVEIHTYGSAADTLLAVYTGTAVGSLTLVAENDDMVADVSFASRVLFTAVAGQEYQIAVDSPKTNNNLSGSVMLTITQPPPPPVITMHPRNLNLVHITNGTFSVGVTVSGAAALFQFQWLFSGNPIPGATNATYALGPLSRTNSGLYAVTITNDFGSVTSSNANVWVQVPQRVLSPQRLLDGRVQLFFSDPDGTLSTDPSRFEVHHTLNPSGPTTVWTTNAGGISASNGRFLYVDQTAGAVSRRTYRVIEK
ncbi:MAG: hypothetical protein EBS05_11280 [Proteobacteria bacterium]|nr:hypothetical protein [Pseudomonadota bacterium]